MDIYLYAYTFVYGWISYTEDDGGSLAICWFIFLLRVITPFYSKDCVLFCLGEEEGTQSLYFLVCAVARSHQF